MPNPDVAWSQAARTEAEPPVPPEGRWRRFTASLPMRTALLAVAAVWLLGAVWSFTEQSAFAGNKGFSYPHLLPLVIDGFAVAMAGVAWAASLDARPAVAARLATVVAVAASSASNGAWAYLRTNHDLTAVVLGVAVPIAANLAFEVLLAEMRRQVQRRRGLPPPVAIPYPRLIRLALAPFRTFVEWRALVLDLTQMELAVARRPETVPTAPEVVVAGRDGGTEATAPVAPDPTPSGAPGRTPVVAPGLREPRRHAPGRHEPGRHEPGRHEPAVREPVGIERVRRELAQYSEIAQQQSAQHQPAQHQPAQHQPAQHEPADAAPTGYRAAHEPDHNGYDARGSVHREPADREPTDREPADREPVHREPVHREPAVAQPVEHDGVGDDRGHEAAQVRARAFSRADEPAEQSTRLPKAASSTAQNGHQPARRRDLEAVPAATPPRLSTARPPARANNGSRRPIDPRVELLAAHLASTEDAGEFTGEMVGPLLNIDVAPRTGRRLLGLARELVNERAQSATDPRDDELSAAIGSG